MIIDRKLKEKIETLVVASDAHVESMMLNKDKEVQRFLFLAVKKIQEDVIEYSSSLGNSFDETKDLMLERLNIMTEDEKSKAMDIMRNINSKNN